MSTSAEKEKRETFWTKTEKETSKETYGCEILVENGSPADVQTKDAPTDASIVTYTVDGKEHQEFFAKFMKASIKTIKDSYNQTVIRISAQTYLKRFYNNLEFKEVEDI